MKDFIYANDLKKITVEKNSKRYKTYDKIIEKNTTTTGPQSVVLSLTFNHLSTFQYSIQRLLTPVLRSL